MPKYKSQAERRRAQRTQDLHGRAWAGTIEIETGVFTGPLTPVGWAPPALGNGVPLLPPQHYFRFSAESPGTFSIDYVSWEADVAAAERAWDDRLLQLAKTLHPHDYADAIQAPSVALRDAVGPRPLIPSVLVRACAAGVPYALGLSAEMPAGAARYFTPEPRAAARPLEDFFLVDGSDAAEPSDAERLAAATRAQMRALQEAGVVDGLGSRMTAGLEPVGATATPKGRGGR